MNARQRAVEIIRRAITGGTHTNIAHNGAMSPGVVIPLDELDRRINEAVERLNTGGIITERPWNDNERPGVVDD